MSTQRENNFQAIIAHAKEYGFIFPSSEIYDGLSAVYDYGPYGSELKKNIRDYWWRSMTQLSDNIVGIDAAIFMHPTTWKASGHIDSFSDPMIDNKDSKKRYRVDHLFEAHAEKLVQTGKQAEADALLKTMDELLAKEDYVALKQLLDDNKIVCSISKTANWTDIRQFNLMFNTQLGSVSEETNTIYLRPETAQGIFVNFLNVQKSARMKIPFGIAQTGKAFRNEIVARQFIFRMREFEQMEMQFFCRPGTELEWYEKWKQIRLEWHLSLGSPKEKLRFHDHVKLAHYANAAVDIEFDFPFGFKELEGIHSRTDFDLKRHQEFSGKKISYFDTEINQHYIPFVVETSIGLDRMFLAILSNSYEEETLQKEDGTTDSRIVLHISPKIAPIKLAIFPLTKKDGLPDLATKIFNDCRQRFKCFYEEKDAIGKRYRRQDAIGTPFCITIDHQSKEDETVTLRHRDTMQQERIAIKDLKNKIQSYL
ncbi:glycine--tRNA ligase [Arachidicoccus sp.]|jgi:glycyl-tRNA synthetase|uniref:glycine--tRNA ligase n=1 Tax=Arachidicoccus sp. TaxID=1872624 RepID=UPI003D23C3D9